MISLVNLSCKPLTCIRIIKQKKIYINLYIHTIPIGVQIYHKLLKSRWMNTSMPFAWRSFANWTASNQKYIQQHYFLYVFVFVLAIRDEYYIRFCECDSHIIFFLSQLTRVKLNLSQCGVFAYDSKSSVLIDSLLRKQLFCSGTI